MDSIDDNRYIENQYLMTNVRYDDKWFMVSSINRISYYEYTIVGSETMVWEWIPEEKKRGECLGEFGGMENSSVEHFLCVEHLREHGSMVGYDD